MEIQFDAKAKFSTIRDINVSNRRISSPTCIDVSLHLAKFSTFDLYDTLYLWIRTKGENNWLVESTRVCITAKQKEDCCSMARKKREGSSKTMSAVRIVR